jgi:hypothetical protein
VPDAAKKRLSRRVRLPEPQAKISKSWQKAAISGVEFGMTRSTTTRRGAPCRNRSACGVPGRLARGSRSLAIEHHDLLD